MLGTTAGVGLGVGVDTQTNLSLSLDADAVVGTVVLWVYTDMSTDTDVGTNAVHI